jgi:eukaryotic-like serine/threonine-protein kinase
MTLTTGSKLAHYEITEKIGEGGMGVVYKAKDSHLDRFVAIKVLPPERVADPERKRRFVQEAKAASVLNHPNIITVHDIDERDGVDFIVMEYVRGKTLDEMIPSKGLKLGDALKYGVQIADALAKAHSAGIIHRDVKPYNVMVGEDGRVKLLDFGLAKLTEAAPLGEDEATRTLPTTDKGTIVGTVAYMSPEQAEGKRLDARSDIFSFGSVLYEMVTGRRAFQKESKTSTLAAIIHKEPEPLEAVIPHDLERIIKRCLHKDPARRFQHLDDAKVALEELKEESDSGKLTPSVGNVEKTQKTIAVLPFANLSSEKDQNFVDGLSEEILNSLAQIPNLKVMARTSSFSFKGANKTVQEIAGVLGVENILEGSVRKAGNALRITTQLVRAADGSYLWSKTYDRELKDIFAIQEDIATAVAGELKATLGIGKSLKQLGGTENMEAYEHYLLAKGLWQRTLDEGNVYNTLKRAHKSIDAAIELDPKFALAWAHKSIIHLYLSIFGPANHAESEHDAALSTALKAIELEPKLWVGYFSLCCIQAAKGEFIEAEASYIKAHELTYELSWLSIDQPRVLAIGNIRKAQEVMKELVRNDPLNMELRGFYLLTFGLLGDIRRAEEEYKRGRPLFGNQWFWGNVLISILRLGACQSLSRDELVYSDSTFDAAKVYLDSPKEGLVELHRLLSKDNLTRTDFIIIAVWAAYFGDAELTADAMEKVLRIQAADALFFWLPVMREVRQKPRFKALVKKIGLVDYWNKFGWPDICHQLDSGDFKCD